MEQEYKFIDFRIISLREFLNDHRECNTESIIGKGNFRAGFRFIVCRKCNEVYFVGKI